MNNWTNAYTPYHIIRLVLLTPSQEKQLFNNLQKQDRLFDNIASLILPCKYQYPH